MLVLTRKQNEGILIGNDIVITVINIEGDKIRLGIEAPKNVRVIVRNCSGRSDRERMAAQSEYRPIEESRLNRKADNQCSYRYKISGGLIIAPLPLWFSYMSA